MRINNKNHFSTNQIDAIIDDLDKCGDTHCGNIITSAQIKTEGLKFLKKVNKKCKSKSDTQRKKYNTCFNRLQKTSKYARRLTKRKKCEDKNCKTHQDRLKSFLANPKK